MASIAGSTSTWVIASPVSPGNLIQATITGYQVTGTGANQAPDTWGTFPTVTNITVVVDSVARTVNFNGNGTATAYHILINGQVDTTGWTFNWTNAATGTLFFGPSANWTSGSAVTRKGGHRINSTFGTTGGDTRDRGWCPITVGGVTATYNATVAWYDVAVYHNGATGATRGDIVYVFPVGVSGVIDGFTQYYNGTSVGHNYIGGPTSITFNNIFPFNVLWHAGGAHGSTTNVAPLNNYTTYFNGDGGNWSKVAPFAAVTGVDKVIYWDATKSGAGTLPIQLLGGYNQTSTGLTNNRSNQPILFNGYRFISLDANSTAYPNVFNSTNAQGYNQGGVYDYALQSRLNYTFTDVFAQSLTSVRVNVTDGNTVDNTRTRFIPSYSLQANGVMTTTLLSNAVIANSAANNTLTINAADVYGYYVQTGAASYATGFSTGAVTNSLSPTGVGWDPTVTKIAYAHRWGYADGSYAWTATGNNASRTLPTTLTRDQYVKTTTVADEVTALARSITPTLASSPGGNITLITTSAQYDGNQFWEWKRAWMSEDDRRVKTQVLISNPGEITLGAANLTLSAALTRWTPTTGLLAVTDVVTTGNVTLQSNTAFGTAYVAVTGGNVTLPTGINYLDVTATGNVTLTNPGTATNTVLSNGGAIVSGGATQITVGAANIILQINNTQLGGNININQGANPNAILAMNTVSLAGNVVVNRTGTGTAIALIENITYNGYTITAGTGVAVNFNYVVTIANSDTIDPADIRVARIWSTVLGTGTEQTVTRTGGLGTGQDITFSARVPLQSLKSFVCMIDGYDIAATSTSADAGQTVALSELDATVLNFDQPLVTADNNFIGAATVTYSSPTVSVNVPSTIAYTASSIAVGKIVIRRIQERAVNTNYHYNISTGEIPQNLVSWNIYGYAVRSAKIFTVVKATSNSTVIQIPIYITDFTSGTVYANATSSDILLYVQFLLASPGAVLILSDADRSAIAEFAVQGIEPSLIPINDNVKDSSLLIPATRNLPGV